MVPVSTLPSSLKLFRHGSSLRLQETSLPSSRSAWQVEFPAYVASVPPTIRTRQICFHRISDPRELFNKYTSSTSQCLNAGGFQVGLQTS